MSLRGLNHPPLCAAAGVGLAASLPSLGTVLSSSASLPLLMALNAAAFAVNVVAVSVPGRIDGRQDEEMRGGNLNPHKGEDSPLVEKKGGEEAEAPSAYGLNRSRTLVNPSGWAFAVWGPIYVGEAAFVAAQFLAPDAAAAALVPEIIFPYVFVAGLTLDPDVAAAALLSQITAPFVAANLFQSLWCASFRASYGGRWEKYVSVGMLAGTAGSLSLVHAAGLAAVPPSPLSRLLATVTAVKFGWTTAATLVNLNGSLASDDGASPRSLVALGNASALAATALGVGVTLARSAPAYGLTVAWALAACADGMAKRIPSESEEEEETLARGARVQKYLCGIGSIACAVVAAFAGLA